MRILFLAHPEQDYLQYMIFNGLCEVYGEEEIIVYPFVLSYMGVDDRFYVLNDGSRGMTNPCDYMVKRDMRMWTFEEVVENLKDTLFILLASPRSYNVKALRFLKKHFSPLPPIVFMDGEDGIDIKWDLINEFNPIVSFKRELTQDLSSKNIFPLPFSAIVNEFTKEDKPKDLDVFCLMGDTHERRRKIIKRLLEENLPNSYIGIDSGRLPWQDPERFKIAPLKSYSDYIDLMSRAKINISIRGWGFDSVRKWEVMLFSGLVLADKLDIIIPNDFKDGEHLVYYKDEEDIIKKIHYYLSHDSEREKIGKAGREYCYKFHTNSSRVKYMLEKIQHYF